MLSGSGHVVEADSGVQWPVAAGVGMITWANSTYLRPDPPAPATHSGAAKASSGGSEPQLAVLKFHLPTSLLDPSTAPELVGPHGATRLSPYQREALVRAQRASWSFATQQGHAQHQHHHHHHQLKTGRFEDGDAVKLLRSAHQRTRQALRIAREAAAAAAAAEQQQQPQRRQGPRHAAPPAPPAVRQRSPEPQQVHHRPSWLSNVQLGALAGGVVDGGGALAAASACSWRGPWRSSGPSSSPSRPSEGRIAVWRLRSVRLPPTTASRGVLCCAAARSQLAFVFDPLELGLSLSFGVEVFEPGHHTPLHVHRSGHELFFLLSGARHTRRRQPCCCWRAALAGCVLDFASVWTLREGRTPAAGRISWPAAQGQASQNTSCVRRPVLGRSRVARRRGRRVLRRPPHPRAGRCAPAASVLAWRRVREGAGGPWPRAAADAPFGALARACACAGDCIVFPPGTLHGLDNNTNRKLYALQVRHHQRAGRCAPCPARALLLAAGRIDSCCCACVDVRWWDSHLFGRFGRAGAQLPGPARAREPTTCALACARVPFSRARAQMMCPDDEFVAYVQSGTSVGRLDDEDICTLTDRAC